MMSHINLAVIVQILQLVVQRLRGYQLQGKVEATPQVRRKGATEKAILQWLTRTLSSHQNPSI